MKKAPLEVGLSEKDLSQKYIVYQAVSSMCMIKIM